MTAQESGKEKSTSQKKEDSLKTVEELALSQGHPTWMLSGVKTFYHWGEGKLLSEKKYTSAISKWLKKKVGERNE